MPAPARHALHFVKFMLCESWSESSCGARPMRMKTFSVLGADAGIPGDAVGTVPRSANRFSSQVLGCCCTSQARADTDTTSAATSLRASTKRVTCNIIFKSSGFGQEHSSETFTAEGGQRIGRVEGREFGIGVDNRGRDCHLRPLCLCTIGKTCRSSPHSSLRVALTKSRPLSGWGRWRGTLYPQR